MYEEFVKIKQKEPSHLYKIHITDIQYVKKKRFPPGGAGAGSYSYAFITLSL